LWEMPEGARYHVAGPRFTHDEAVDEHPGRRPGIRRLHRATGGSRRRSRLSRAAHGPRPRLREGGARFCAAYRSGLGRAHRRGSESRICARPSSCCGPRCFWRKSRAGLFRGDAGRRIRPHGVLEARDDLQPGLPDALYR
jgi:hypothetical protein